MVVDNSRRHDNHDGSVFLHDAGSHGWMMCGPSSRTSSELFGSGRFESAREILDKRYARGDIGKEEYEERKRDIERTDS